MAMVLGTNDFMEIAHPFLPGKGFLPADSDGIFEILYPTPYGLTL
jgi:hypothetical protein